MTDDFDEEKVGYARPPKSGQFQKGQSGNPSGKRRRPRRPDPTNLDEEIAAELDQVATINVRGREQRVSLRTVTAKKTVKRAVSDDDPRVLRQVRDADARAALSRRRASRDVMGPGDDVIVERALERIARIRGWRTSQ